MIRILAVAAISLGATQASSAQTVAVPSFQSVELAGGGDVVVRPGPRQRVTILSGSARFTSFTVQRGGKLRIAACSSACPSNYRLQIVIEMPRLPDLAVAGGGQITASAGFAPQDQLSVAVRGGGSIDATRVAATSVSAAVSGGGEVRVRPRSDLSAAIMGGGEIAYSGNPRVSSAVNGGGTVRRLR